MKFCKVCKSEIKEEEFNYYTLIYPLKTEACYYRKTLHFHEKCFKKNYKKIFSEWRC